MHVGMEIGDYGSGKLDRVMGSTSGVESKMGHEVTGCLRTVYKAT